MYAASNRHQVVADAAGDSILDVRDGRVSLLAVIPSSENGSDQVPTSVTRGPDGAYYVGTLAEGAGNGGAKVWRIVPGHAPEVYADGLTAVVDIAFGPDGSRYASEFLADLTSETDPSGAVGADPAVRPADGAGPGRAVPPRRDRGRPARPPLCGQLEHPARHRKRRPGVPCRRPRQVVRVPTH